ncbi:hypothetical protein FALBO_15929 [Fusarium albosuccineum]|uniref:Uncharacterized protein n=1 Tax=Fusarium albosuccineum TaxID=1237068 RepID=A0A8H4KQE2_9HYPO|nr:hypothetical protein FALBO_15929 [Fusarium albosuccineum]
MIPVRPVYLRKAHFRGIVSNNSVCILNLTRLTVPYVNSLVNHAPGNIATKRGNKQLPLELWNMIIDWAEMDPKSDIYCLVQARSLEKYGSELVLSCAKITEWNRCGYLETESAVDEYCNYLRRPGEGHDPKRPFVLPNTTNSDSLIMIKELLLCSENEIIFCSLGAHDLIARVERGDCSLCQGRRWINEFGENEGSKFFGYTLSPRRDGWVHPDWIIGCPLCIGLGGRPWYDGPRTPQNDEQEEELEAVETYDQRVKERFEELGYDWVPSESYGRD